MREHEDFLTRTKTINPKLNKNANQSSLAPQNNTMNNSLEDLVPQDKSRYDYSNNNVSVHVSGTLRLTVFARRT